MTGLTLPSRYVPEKTPPGGGMSDVVVCTDTHLDRRVLIKTLKITTESKRLLDELRALQAIRSKHVVQIYDVISDAKGRVVGIVEEFLPGNDLMSVPSPKTLREFLMLAYPIAEGIADIHAQKRVHRDIKPNNMKFDAEGCLKIFDFGLSRIEDVDASTIGIVGTKGFLAPELFKADNKGHVAFSAAVDTFAFGSTVLFLALGKLPLALRKLPPLIPNPEVTFAGIPFKGPGPLIDVLNSCFAADPADRPLMADVAVALRIYLLRDRHRALIMNGPNVYTLDSTKREVRLSVVNRGSLALKYDGLQFCATEISGDVSINNVEVSDGFVLPGSCVIVLGAASLGSRRIFVTVDISHPEVPL